MNDSAKAGLLKTFADLIKSLVPGSTGRFGVMFDLKQGGLVNVEKVDTTRIDLKGFGESPKS